MKYIAFAIVLASTSVASAQNRTTTVEDARGSRTTIVTDPQGTRSFNSATGGNLYSAGGDRHEEQMQKHTGTGGRVVDDKR